MALTAPEPKESSLSKRERLAKPSSAFAEISEVGEGSTTGVAPTIAAHMRALHGSASVRSNSRPTLRQTRRYRERTFRVQPEAIEWLKGFLADYNQSLPPTMQMSMDELGRVLIQLFREANLKVEEVTSLRERAS